jgi:hypothetical protein
MSTVTLRHPAVAGTFYPRNSERLRDEALSYLTAIEVKAEPAIGCIVPHAGYMYSGHVAGAVFAHIAVPKRCIVICPNHTGMGHPLAIMSEGAWETPLGDIPITSDLAAELKQAFPAFHEDAAAHRAEHAVEVELPFLQLRQPELTFVPIVLGLARYEILEQIGKAVAQVIAAQAEPVLIVASSDMNHYESDALTRIKDQRALEPILRLDPRGLYDVVTEQDISMCGFCPAVTMLVAARQLGARSADLVKYATSGDISGDRDQVVGYAGVMVR